MAPTILPPQKYLRECLDYNPETGDLRWRQRPQNHFLTPRAWHTWNSTYAGKKPGSIRDHGYLYLIVNYRQYGAHRVIWKWMTGQDPTHQIDHRDMNKANNRWQNLREATKAQNMMNAEVRRDNVLGIKGVTYNAHAKRFAANIQHEGKTHFLGYFPTPDAAKEAYDQAAKQWFGDFAHR